MRIYLDGKEAELLSVICNYCKKELPVENGILKAEAIRFKHTFGYFSKHDGQTESFDLCEECYRKITGKFQIPVEKREETEFM